MNEYPNILTSKETNDIKLQKIAELDGFKEKTAKLFSEILGFNQHIRNQRFYNDRLVF